MPMTRQQAELAVDRNPQLRGLGPNREAAIRKVMQMDPDQLVGNVPAGAPVGRPATRQTAISAAMGGPEEPRMVTPAAPAPVRPGIPIMAPRPEAKQIMPADVRQMAAPAPAPVRAAPAAEPAPAAPKSSYVSPARIAAREAEREMALINQVVEALAKEGQPVPPEARIRLERAQQRFASATAEANAEEAAQVDAERAAIFARQEGLLKGREEQVGREEKNALSDALIKGGLAMMNPQRGANFLAALSGGLGQGLETYDAAKAKAVEARARLGSETNALALQRIDALTQARSAAVNAIRRGDEVDERTARMAKMTNEEITDVSLRPFVLQKAKADASKAQTEADYAPKVFESELGVNAARATDLLRGDGGTGGGSGGTGTLPPGARLETEGRLATAYAEQDEAYQNWVAAGRPIIGEVKQGDKKWLAASKYEAARGKVNNLLGALGRPKLGAPPTRRAAARPAAAPAAAGPKSAKPKGFPGTQAAWDVMTPAEKKLFQ